MLLAASGHGYLRSARKRWPRIGGAAERIATVVVGPEVPIGIMVQQLRRAVEYSRFSQMPAPDRVAVVSGALG